MPRTSLYIGLYLLVQVTLPLRFYLRSSDPLDERFAWRMFSNTRLTRCEVEFRVTDSSRLLAIDSEFHLAWTDLAQRGRRSVIDGMAAHLCKDETMQPVTLSARCIDAENQTFTLVRERTDVCSSGAR